MHRPQTCLYPLSGVQSRKASIRRTLTASPHLNDTISYTTAKNCLLGRASPQAKMHANTRLYNSKYDEDVSET